MPWGQVRASRFVVGAGTLVVIQLLMEKGCTTSKLFEHFIGGNSSLFMWNGKLIRSTPWRGRINEHPDIHGEQGPMHGDTAVTWADVACA